MRRRRSRRRGRRGGGGGFGLGRSLGGFAGRDTIAAIAGATAVGFFAPMIARQLPASWTTSKTGQIMGAVVVGVIGYFVLRRISRTAALGFAAASIAPVIGAQLAQGGVAGLGGIGIPDGQSYLPNGDDMSGNGEDELGAYDDAAAEVL